jgi:DeoR/GlpR family transcriptional regulator of sugar metabolism
MERQGAEKSRKELVREILISKPFTSLEELEKAFPEVSSMTLRRDIEYFEAQGDVIKVRGGARALRFITLPKEDSFYKRASENTAAKQRIAAQAAAFIQTGRSLFFDSGTTVMQLVPLLPPEKLTISTTDPNVALALVKNEQVVVNIVGGCLSRDNLSLSGMQALAYIRQTNIDMAFISPSGFSLECGFTSGNYNESQLKNEVITKAHSIIMMVEAQKLGRSMPYTFGQLSDIQVLITDEEPPAPVRQACEQYNVTIIVAK